MANAPAITNIILPSVSAGLSSPTESRRKNTPYVWKEVMAVIIINRETKNRPSWPFKTDLKEGLVSWRWELEAEENSCRDTWIEVIAIGSIRRDASIAKEIPFQSMPDPVLPISAPVTAIITAAPAASDIIFIEDAMPIRFSGTRSRIKASPGP